MYNTLLTKFIGCCCIVSILFMMSNSARAQDINEQNDEELIKKHWKTLSYTRPVNALAVLEIPSREFDSPMFCHEMIRYKSGYIINSITSNPGPTVDVTTKYYYIDTVSWQLSRVSYLNSDTIESVIGGGNDSIVISVKKNGRRNISCIKNSNSTTILDSRDTRLLLLDTAKWVKLGWFKNKIYAFTPDGIAIFESNQWRLLTKISLDGFFLDTLRYRRSLTILPTLNIQVTEQRVWFLQEIVQERTSHLLYVDLKTGVINELYRSLGYRDNYEREVFSFHVGPRDELIVATARLMEKYMVNHVNSDSSEVWIFENQLNTTKGLLSRVFVSAVNKYNDTIYFAGYNGLFRKVGDNIMPLIFWKNHKQTIPDKTFGDLHWEFTPRYIERLTQNLFLIGGLWGGLYLVDVDKSSIKCLDDIAFDKVGKKEIQ